MFSGWVFLLDFVALSTRTHHGACVRGAIRNRVDPHRGEFERIVARANEPLEQAEAPATPATPAASVGGGRARREGLPAKHSGTICQVHVGMHSSFVRMHVDIEFVCSSGGGGGGVHSKHTSTQGNSCSTSARTHPWGVRAGERTTSN